MMIKGMSTVRGAIGKLAAVAALASGLALASPARADTWQDAVRDADDLHDAVEALHERALRLNAHNVLAVTAALDHAAADLYHELKHHPSAEHVVPALRQTEALLNEACAAIDLSHDIHHDRKAVALLKDARHHLVDTAQHIESVLHDHDHHHRPAPPVRYYPPRTPWQTSPFGSQSSLGSQYSAPPAWYGQPAPPAVHSSGYRGASQGYGGYRDQSSGKLPRVVISDIFAR